MKHSLIFILASCLMTLSSCAGDGLYPWEKNRTELPAISDMTLCYGGSDHRGDINDPESEYWWRKDRFAPHVTYVDENGEEHWLFESFLFLEFADTKNNMNYSLGYAERTASDRNSWQQLIDYWFAPDNGFDALDAAIEEAKGRIGEPKSKRYVIMNLPEAIVYEKLDKKQPRNTMNFSSTYWGELDGRTLDFEVGEDRVAALTWYIDQVRMRFNEGKYKNIELVGFYLINEDLAVMHEGKQYGYDPFLKNYDQCFPAISRYLDSVNEGLYWIPYYFAGGYELWKEVFEIDWAVMQPNHYWDIMGKKPMDKFFPVIEEYGYGMELEFDDNVLEESRGIKDYHYPEITVDPDVYKQQFRDYMVSAKEQGVYGTKPFALYAGQNTLYKLSKSTDPEDQKFYHEFCKFIMENPIKKY